MARPSVSGRSDTPGRGCATAVRNGDGYVINGVKCFISNGSIASLYTVFGLTDPERGARSMSGFIVPADSPGIEIAKIEDKMGQRASNTAQIAFTDVRVPRENLLGREGRGFAIALKTLDHARAGVAALATGVARRALELAAGYAQSRIQFDKPIAEQHGGAVVVDGREMIITGSNDYLGLTQDPRLKAAARASLDHFGTSCTGSRFLTGTLTLHERLEN